MVQGFGLHASTAGDMSSLPGQGTKIPQVVQDGQKKKKLPLSFHNIWASQIAQRRRICLPLQETQVRFLGREDPLEEEMATHSSILPWRIPWTEEPGGHKELDTIERTHTFIIYTSTSNQHIFYYLSLNKHCVLDNSSF